MQEPEEIKLRRQPTPEDDEFGRIEASLMADQASTDMPVPEAPPEKPVMMTTIADFDD